MQRQHRAQYDWQVAGGRWQAAGGRCSHSYQQGGGTRLAETSPGVSCESVEPVEHGIFPYLKFWEEDWRACSKLSKVHILTLQAMRHNII